MVNFFDVSHTVDYPVALCYSRDFGIYKGQKISIARFDNEKIVRGLAKGYTLFGGSI